MIQRIVFVSKIRKGVNKMKNINTRGVQNASEMVIITNNEQLYTNTASEGLYQGNYPSTASEGLYQDKNN